MTYIDKPIYQLTLTEALDGLTSKKFSSLELTQACLDRSKELNSKLNVYISFSDNVLEEAKKADEQIAKDPSVFEKKPLLGIPIALKDLYLTKDLKTTAGSAVLNDYLPQYNGTTVKKLTDAGAVFLGKLNQDAWGHGGSGENSDFGPTKNPWDDSRIPGGSSSGSGAAIAADMCLAAMGTDTGGSIRNPAALCNGVGLKPTYGRVSRYGVVAMASSLDSIGHITKTVEDSAKILEVTAGHDPMDGTTPKVEVPKYFDNLKKTDNSLKIGIPKEYFGEGLDPEVKNNVDNAIKLLESHGFKIQEVSLPYTEYGIATYYIIMSSETSSNLGRYDGIRYGNDRASFGKEAKRRIMLGSYTLSAGYYDAYYKKALQVRTKIKEDFEKAFEKVDILITPVTPTPAFKFGAKQDPLSMYLADVYTVTPNLAGIPGLAVPCGFSKNNLPIGMQILGPQFSEEILFKVGHFYQQLTDWHERRAIIK